MELWLALWDPHCATRSGDCWAVAIIVGGVCSHDFFGTSQNSAPLGGGGMGAGPNPLLLHPKGPWAAAPPPFIPTAGAWTQDGGESSGWLPRGLWQTETNVPQRGTPHHAPPPPTRVSPGPRTSRAARSQAQARHVRFVHPAFQNSLAEGLGVQSLRYLMLVDQKLTTSVSCPTASALRQYLGVRSSAGSVGLILDALAVADAAGAKSFRVMFDMRSHGQKSLLQPSLSAFQVVGRVWGIGRGGGGWRRAGAQRYGGPSAGIRMVCSSRRDRDYGRRPVGG